MCADSGTAVVGLAGYAQVGKDTVAYVLMHDHGFTRVAFADAVRYLALEINPIIGRHRLATIVAHIGWEAAKRIPEVRRFLQDLGNGVRTVLGESTWIDVVGRHLDQLVADGLDRIVITDLRFANEVRLVHDLGGQVVRLTRAGVGPANDHVSERAHELDVDHEIANDSPPELTATRILSLIS